MRLDHIVIAVPTLEEGIATFTALGFEVVRGGSHGTTENALIAFSDGSYIELLATTPGLSKTLVKVGANLGLVNLMARRRSDVYRRLLPWLASSPGPLDWCVRVDDIEAALDTCTSADTHTGQSRLAVREFERALPDGRIAQWYLGSTANFEFPFFIQDISDTAIRVPPRSTPHLNGSLGIHTLCLASPNIEQLNCLALSSKRAKS